MDELISKCAKDAFTIIWESEKVINARIRKLIHYKYCDDLNLNSLAKKVVARTVASIVNDSYGLLELYGISFATDATKVIEEESKNMFDNLKKILCSHQINSTQKINNLDTLEDISINPDFLSIANFDNYIFQYIDTFSKVSEWAGIGVQLFTRHSFKTYDIGFALKLGYNIATVTRYNEELSDYLNMYFDRIMQELRWRNEQLQNKCIDAFKIIIENYNTIIEKCYLYFLEPCKYQTKYDYIYNMCCLLYYEIVKINTGYWFIECHYDPFDRTLIYYIAGRVKQVVHVLSQTNEEEIAYFISEYLYKRQF